MTTLLCPTVRLVDPSQWFSGIPHLLGFHPTDSVVVVGLRSHGERALVTVAVRCDLPPAGEPEGFAPSVDQLVQVLSREPDQESLIFVIGGERSTARPPYADLVGRLRLAFESAGLVVRHALWSPSTVGGDEWLCYADSTCRGVVPDYVGTTLAAATVASGQITHAQRADLSTAIEPDPPDVLAARSARLARLFHEQAPDPEYFGDGSASWGLGRITAACARFRRGTPMLTETEISGLAAVLVDPLVRDAAVGLIDTDPAAADRLFTALTRSLPEPYRAEPACLLALSAYARGDGVSARIALDTALSAGSGHRLANLLSLALDNGLPPRAVTRIIETGAALARDLTGGGTADDPTSARREGA